MNKTSIIISIIIVLTLLCLFIFNMRSIDTLMYFPLDESALFINDETELSLIDKNVLEWDVQSTSDQSVYLRQDISLLYANGKFKGVLNQWQQNVSYLQNKKRVPHVGNVHYNTISFHHGEIHHNEDDITSVQKMSNNSLYIYEITNHTYSSFKVAKNKREEHEKNKIDKLSNEKLYKYWQRLIEHFNIDQQQYIAIPLTDLIQFEEKTIANLSKKQTDRVLGQLWEGLYKNYIIHITDEKTHQTPHYIPLILIDNDATHLYVLFELNGEKKMLKQLI